MDGGLEEDVDSKVYTRQEMIERVLHERKERAEKECFQLKVGETVYGTHQVTTAAGRVYQISVRDFGKSQGYCSCLDFQINKLGTCKHLLFAVNKLKKDLPWNPAKKNQRIGRIHRIGQKHQKLTVINLVSTGSIEERIASGIVVKEALFDAVLNEADLTDEVDFSAKGRATMIEQIEKMVAPFVVEEAEKVELLETSSAEPIEETVSLTPVPEMVYEKRARRAKNCGR